MPVIRLALCAFALVVTTSALAEEPASVEDPIGTCMESAGRQFGFSGVAYARLGERVIERSFGTSDEAGRTPITDSTRFDIGSAGKMFTALAIAILVDRGQVRLDAPISQYLAELPPALASVTVAQLLNHTSGLGNYFRPENRAPIEAATSVAQLLPLALAEPPAFTPGSKRAYSNSGFVVLGAIVEKVSGLSYPAFVEQQILQPLGMRHTRFDAVGSATPMTRMSPDGPLPHAMASPLRGLRASPAGGMYSTVEDVSRLLSAIEQERLIGPATWRQFLLPRPDPSGQPGVYGYGFNVHMQPYHRVGHGGGAPGVNAEIALYPESGWQLIALSNGDPPRASRMVDVLQQVVHAKNETLACQRALQLVQTQVSQR